MTKNAPAQAASDVEKSETVKLLPLKIVQSTIRVVGISSLITHAWSEKAKTMMRDKQMKLAKTAKEAKNPQIDFEGAKYKNDAGKDCVPTLAFKNAIVSAARFSDDMKMTVLRGAIFIPGELLPITFKRCVMREDMVRVGMGTADLRYRPEYQDWSIDLPVTFNSSVLSASQVMNLLKIAGFSVGICEWRPEKNGQFGRFDIDESSVLKAAK